MKLAAVQLPHDVQLPRQYSNVTVQAANTMISMQPASVLLEKLEYFVNGLPYDVKVVFRNGLSVIIPHVLPNVGFTKGRLMVRHDYMYRGGVKPDLQQLSGVVGVDEGNERGELLKAMNLSESLLANGYKRIMLDYFVEDDLITKTQDGIYIPELDIVVTRYVSRPTYHPSSAEGRALAVKQAVENKKFTYDIEIVDPDDEYGHRFCNMAGMVHRIEPNRRKDVAPGVYLKAVSKDVIKDEHFEFDKADEALKLFRTRDEALAFGDLAKMRDKEIEELKTANVKLKHQLEASSMQNKERYENRSYEQKDHYESRSYARKDTSEAMKWVPAAAAAAAVAIGTVIKLVMAPATGFTSLLWPF